MLDLESRGQGSIPTRGGIIFCFKFCNRNLHNIARSDRMRFKTKNPNKYAYQEVKNHFGSALATCCQR